MASSRASRPVVALRADVGGRVGLGHVRRCLALARAAADWADCHLLVDGPEAGPAAAGVPAREVPAGVAGGVAAARAVGAGALVVDSYRLDHQALRAAWPDRPLILVDDFGRWPLPGDIVVNSAAGLTPPAVDADRYLLGPRYALLAPEFAAVPSLPARPTVDRILLALGGGTSAVLMGQVARAVRAAAPGAALDVVVGPVGDAVAHVRRELDGLERLTLHQGLTGLRPLMVDVDLAVSAGGVTLLELAATGVPTVGVCLADNQRENLVGLAAREAIVFAGRHDDPRLGLALIEALAPLAASADARSALARRARAVVDGGGAGRVAERIRVELNAGHAAAGASR